MDIDAPTLTGEIIQIIERHPNLAANRLDNLIKIRSIIENVLILRPLKKVLCFLDKKKLLDQNLFDFIIKNKRNLNQLSIFLDWLEEFRATSDEMLAFFKQFDDLNDIDKTIARLKGLELRNNISDQSNFTFFSGLVDLINEGMDEVKYIDLIKGIEHTPILLKALKILKQNDLLQDNYYDFVFDKENFSPVIKAELISKLKKNEALNEQNFNVCKKNTSPILLLEVVNILEQHSIALKDNFLPLAIKNNYSLLNFLKYLEKNSLLTGERIKAIMQVSDASLKYLMHITLITNDLALSEDLSLLLVENSERLRKLVKSFMLLKNENYLTLENYKLLSTKVNYPDVVFQFAQALVVLRNNQLDAIRWKNEAYNSENPLQLVFLLKELNKASILSETNVAWVKKINVPNSFLRILRVLNRLHRLTEESFENLVKLDRVLASSYSLYEKLSRMKSISFELIADVFLIASEDLDKTAKLEKIEQLLELERKASNKPRLSINREQSTHVSSVQVSTSQSAKHFLQKYGEKIVQSNIDKNFLEITDELKLLASDDNVKNRAALNALEKIISSSDYIEPISKLSLKELLVLLWEGIQDDSQRISSLLDAKIQIIEGLYEIQRGGNIDAFGQDNGLPDEAICCTGAFNKLIEKMVGIHQFAEIINITPELAATKFPLIVKEKAVDYLINLEHEQLLLTYDLLKEEGIAFIWKHIASHVQEAMLAEFSPLYQLESGAVTEDFKCLMASHQDLDIDERLLASIKSSYALRKLDIATTVNTFSPCEEVSGNQKLKRSVKNCFKKNISKEKRYHPFSALNRQFEYALSFFIGLVEQDLEKIVVEKIETLQRLVKARYLSQGGSNDFATISLEGICEIWLMAENFLKESVEINKSNLIEFSGGEKKYYIAIKPNVYRVDSSYLYCSTFNKEALLEINSDSDIDLEEVLETFKETLYPDLPAYQIKTRYLSYFQPESYLPISAFQAMFFGPIQVLREQVNSFEGVPRKGFYKFFLINDELPSDVNLDFLFANGLESARLSFVLEKAPEILSYFSEQEQIALGKLLLKYRIPRVEDQSVLIGNNFDKNLLELLIDYASKDQVISQKVLSELVRETCYSELIKAGLDSEEATLLLENLVQSHNQVKLKLENLVEVSRLSILVAPALIRALNGHSESLVQLASMMGGDHLINESYLSLIQHEGFIKRFPKLATLLQKGQYVLASPICKLLLLSSFYELTKQLLNTPSSTPEYKMAQRLLVDNTILFSALFAESFGLTLGPAGIILDLGITIHQLLIASDYIRQHYHLQVSLWEGIKFELGLDGIVREILETREMVRLNLVSINNLSKSANYYFSNLVLKAPKVIEIEAKKIERKELPHSLLKKIYLAPLDEITSLKYLYRVDTRMGRLQSYMKVDYLKRQLLIEFIQDIFINFSEKNILLVQENNIFSKFEKQCNFNYVYDFSSIAKCFSRILEPFGKLVCIEKKCITTNRILTEGWGVASSTTISDQDIGRIEDMHSLTIHGEIGAMLENKNAFNQDKIWIKVLILFNPIFGNMMVEDGSFLKNQTLMVLIQDPPLADIIVTDRIQSISGFNFTHLNYLNKLHYWVGINSLPSTIEDNFDCLSIYLMPLSLDDPEKTITMLSTSQLIVGGKGPRFVGLEQKQEVIIYFNRGYFLSGYFDFIAPVIIRLYNSTVKSQEIALFGLENYQLCLLENILGAYIFYSLDETVSGHEIFIKVTSRKAITNVNKQLNNAYFIESNQLLNYLTINYSNFFWLPYNITELNISWCEIDCPLITVRSKVSDFLDLTFKGKFKLVNKNYTAWFIFKAEDRRCNFFELNGADLLLSNFASFKKLLGKGFTEFIFSRSDYLNDKLQYNPQGKKIIYRKIQYKLDEDYHFVAVIGELINRSAYTESFANLLPNVAIDLRNEGQPSRVASHTLQINNRLLTGVATTVLLLTNLGKQYMGLLPIFTQSEVSVASLQINVHEINESSYLSRITKPSKDTSDSQLTHWAQGFIVLGSLLTFSILTRFIISYRRRVNNLPGIIEMGLVNAVATPLLTPTVQATHRNTLTSSTAKNIASYYQYTQKNAKQPDIKQKATGQKSTNYKAEIPIFFEQLSQQIIFLKWCIGFYKKLAYPKNVFSEDNFEEFLVRLANELTHLSYSQTIKVRQKKVLHHLLTSVHRLSFLIKNNTTCFLITKKTDFIIWDDFIRDLFIFEKYFKHYFKQHRRSSLVCVLKRLDAISIEINPEFLNCIDYLAAIYHARKLLASLVNILDIKKRCDALDLPDPQWLISRLNLLQDALIDLKNSRKLSFSEFKYYLNEVLPEAKRLTSCLENKYFAIDFSSYLNLVAAIKGDCREHLLFQNSNISKAANTSLATHSFLGKESFFTLNKRVVNITDVDYAANDCNRLDFSARNSNLRNTSHSLG